MSHILLTGGTGFIGSHILIELLKNDYKVTILDSNINSSSDVIENVLSISEVKKTFKEKNLNFIKGDIRNELLLDDIFKSAVKEKNAINSVIHLAGLKSVSESELIATEYWDANVLGSIRLVKIMSKYKCNTIIFSSSATIYSSENESCFKEDSLIKPINPYGNTKAAIEKLLSDTFASSPESWKIISLRFFNPIGAHYSGKISEDPKGKPNNIFPIILQVAAGELDYIEVFGNDWDTYDGTGVRDYVHVMDIAEGHLCALRYLEKNPPTCLKVNLGTGKGTSVMELINTFQNVNDLKLNFKIAKKRKGDVAISIADNSLAKKLLGWIPKRNLEVMCRDGWKSKLNFNHK